MISKKTSRMIIYFINHKNKYDCVLGELIHKINIDRIRKEKENDWWFGWSYLGNKYW